MPVPSAPPAPLGSAAGRRLIRCKPKHAALTALNPGHVRGKSDLRSRCPGWVTAELQQRLLDEALEDPESGVDAYGRPRKIWNAVSKWIFVGVSSNEPVPAYNCYPEAPVTALARELRERAARTIEQVLRGEDL